MGPWKRGGSKEPPAPPVRGGVWGLRQGPGEGSGQVMGTPCSRIAWEREAGRQAPRTHRLGAKCFAWFCMVLHGDLTSIGVGTAQGVGNMGSGCGKRLPDFPVDVAGKRRLCSRGVGWGQVEGTELGAGASPEEPSRLRLDLEDRTVGGWKSTGGRRSLRSRHPRAREEKGGPGGGHE